MYESVDSLDSLDDVDAYQPSADLQELCMSHLQSTFDFLARIASTRAARSSVGGGGEGPACHVTVYARRADSLDSGVLQLQRVAAFPPQSGTPSWPGGGAAGAPRPPPPPVGDVLILRSTGAAPTGSWGDQPDQLPSTCLDAEASLLLEEVVALPHSATLVFPLAHAGFLVGLLVAEAASADNGGGGAPRGARAGAFGSGAFSDAGPGGGGATPPGAWFGDDELWALRNAVPVLAAACAMDLRAALAGARAAARTRAARTLLLSARAPLTVMRTFGSMLLPRLGEGGPEHDIASGILMQSKRLSEVVAQLEAALRPGSGTGSGTGVGSAAAPAPARAALPPWAEPPAGTAVLQPGGSSASWRQQDAGDAGWADDCRRLGAVWRGNGQPPLGGAASSSGCSSSTRSGFGTSSTVDATSSTQASGIPMTTGSSSSSGGAGCSTSTALVCSSPDNCADTAPLFRRGGSSDGGGGAVPRWPDAAGGHGLRAAVDGGRVGGYPEACGASRTIDLELLPSSSGGCSGWSCSSSDEGGGVEEVAVAAAAAAATQQRQLVRQQQQRRQAASAFRRRLRRGSGANEQGERDATECNLTEVLGHVLAAAKKLARTAGVDFIVNHPLTVPTDGGSAPAPTRSAQPRGAGAAARAPPRLLPRPPRPLHVGVRALVVQRALGYVLDVALQCTPRGGQVCVTARASGAGVEVCILHTGQMQVARLHPASRPIAGALSQALSHAAAAAPPGARLPTTSGAGAGLVSLEFARKMLAAAGGRVSVVHPCHFMNARTGQLDVGTSVEVWMPPPQQPQQEQQQQRRA